MITNVKEEFEKSFQKFKLKESTLPQRIRLKLNYISDMLKGQKCININQLSEEDQLQVQDLIDVNQKGLMIIFNSIVQTLFNQDISIDRRCLIRNKGFFKSWRDGFLKYDNKYIYINSNSRTSRYRFKNVDIKYSKNSQRSFDFFYKGSYLLTIKFQKAESMMAMYKTVKGLIIQQKRTSEKQKYKNSKIKDKSKVESHDLSKKQENVHQKPNIWTPQKLKQIKEEDLKFNKNLSNLQYEPSELKFEKSILLQQEESKFIMRNSIRMNQNPNKQYEKICLSSLPIDYEMKISTKNMFIGLHKSEAKLILEIILNMGQNSLKLHQILSCIAQSKQWNSNTISEEINYHMKSQQKAIIYRVYEKSSSLLSSHRQTYTILQYKQVNENMAILVEQSLQNQDKKQVYTRSYLKSIFCLESHNNQFKISLESEYDPKGYCNKVEAKQLLFNIYKDIIHYQNYLNEYKIKMPTNTDLFSDKNSRDDYTQHSQEQLSSQLKMRNSMSMEYINNEQKSSDDDPKNQELSSLQLYRKSSKKQPFIFLRPINPKITPTLEYLDLIHKKQYQKFYIKYKMDTGVQEEYDSQTPPYILEEMLRKGGEYQITESKELVFINHKLIQSQSDTLKFIIKQIGANIISGKSVLNISLPVDIFQSRTLLERNASAFGKCPDYFERCSLSDPLTQMKNVLAFLATLPTLQVKMQKPFNPILGQTFQCFLKGIPICYQQINHHPPISSYYMTCPKFTVYGNLIAFADVGINSGTGGNLGILNIKFQNGTHFECYFPPNEISGLIYGQRKFRCYGKGFIFERKNKIFGQFSIQKSKKGIYESKDKLKPGSVIGGIFQINSKFEQYFKSFNMNLKKFPGLSKEHIEKKLCSVSGYWFQELYMDNQNITQGIKAYPLQYGHTCLPSDSNFRTDVLYHKQNNLHQSQKQKERLQNIQRDDKKLRENYAKKK